MSETMEEKLARVNQEIHDARIARIVVQASVALDNSMNANHVITEEYRGFVLFEVFEKLIENYRVREFAARFGKTMILAIILILPSLGAKGILVPEKVIKPLVIVVPAAPKARAGHKGTIKTDAPEGQPAWVAPMMTKYLFNTYGIVPSDTTIYFGSNGCSTLINPYVLQPLSSKQQIKRNQQLYRR